MPAVTIESAKFEDGWPEGTQFRLEWVHDQRLLRGKIKTYREKRVVWTGDVSHSVTRNLDCGKYLWKAHKYDPSGLESFREMGEILVGMDDETWKSVTHMNVENQRPVMTTDGVLFTCGFATCKKRTTSRMAALIHEKEKHIPDKQFDKILEGIHKGEVLHIPIDIGPKKKKRGPGRPPNKAVA